MDQDFCQETVYGNENNLQNNLFNKALALTYDKIS